MATNVDLPEIQKGDTVPYTFRWTDGSNPIDMRGKTLIMMFKLAHVMEDIDAALTKTVEIAVDDADALDGLTPFQLERSETALLVGGTDWCYSIRIIEEADPEPIETTVMYGIIPVGDA